MHRPVGHPEFKLRNNVPGLTWAAASCATASVLDAVTAEISQSACAHRTCMDAQAETPASVA